MISNKKYIQILTEDTSINLNENKIDNKDIKKWNEVKNNSEKFMKEYEKTEFEIESKIKDLKMELKKDPENFLIKNEIKKEINNLNILKSTRKSNVEAFRTATAKLADIEKIAEDRLKRSGKIGAGLAVGAAALYGGYKLIQKNRNKE